MGDSLLQERMAVVRLRWKARIYAMTTPSLAFQRLTYCEAFADTTVEAAILLCELQPSIRWTCAV